MTDRSTDQQRLLELQYNDVSRLEARQRLHIHFGVEPQNLLRWTFDHMRAGLPDAAALLEVGGGGAHFWDKNADQVPPGWRLTLTDFSPGMVAAAAKVVAAHGLNAAVKQADVMDLPFAENSFDGVAAHHMLYHVPDRTHGAAELRRVLKPGGRLFALTNGSEHMRELREWMVRIKVGGTLQNVRLGHGFTLENGADQLRTAFAHVERIDHDTRLEVTEIQPIFDYMYSVFDKHDTLDEDAAAALRDELERTLDRDGVIHIRRRVGLFIAY